MPSGGAKFLVLAFWLSFTTGGSSGAEPFDGVLNKAQTIAGAGASTTTDPLNFDALKQHVANNVVYKYAGSLTTPPCGEGVTWTVVGEPMALSVAAYNKGKATMKFNSRPTQNDPGKDNLIGIASKNYCGVQLCIG